MNSGSNTNGGVSGKCRLGAVPDSPLTGAILRIPLSKGSHKRTVRYIDTKTGEFTNNALVGTDLQVAPNSTDIDVFSPGHRNAFRCTLTSKGYLYCTDNGPNTGISDYS